MAVPISSNWGPPDLSGSINTGVDAILGGIGNYRLQQELANLPRTADGSPDFHAAAIRLLGSNPVAAQQLMKMAENRQLEAYRSRHLDIQQQLADIAADKSGTTHQQGLDITRDRSGRITSIFDVETRQYLPLPGQPGAAPAVAAPAIPQAAIDRLKANPNEAELFERHYKLQPGAAKQYIEGTAPAPAAAPTPQSALPQSQAELQQPPPGSTWAQKQEFRKQQIEALKPDKAKLKEADDSIEAARNALRSIGEMQQLSKQAYGGWFAKTKGDIAAQFGKPSGEATQLLEQKITSTALEQLRATFGGNPTEGERKILLDVQGSVGKTDAVRQKIFADAAEAARRRAKYNQKYANASRSGTLMNYNYTDNTPVD